MSTATALTHIQLTEPALAFDPAGARQHLNPLAGLAEFGRYSAGAGPPPGSRSASRSWPRPTRSTRFATCSTACVRPPARKNAPTTFPPTPASEPRSAPCSSRSARTPW